MADKIVKTEGEWRQELTDEQYHVTREKGTEPAFTGKLCNNKVDGVYRCVCCGNELFDSECKYDSHSGWPSFCSYQTSFSKPVIMPLPFVKSLPG